MVGTDIESCTLLSGTGSCASKLNRPVLQKQRAQRARPHSGPHGRQCMSSVLPALHACGGPSNLTKQVGFSDCPAGWRDPPMNIMNGKSVVMWSRVPQAGRSGGLTRTSCASPPTALLLARARWRSPTPTSPPPCQARGCGRQCRECRAQSQASGRSSPQRAGSAMDCR